MGDLVLDGDPQAPLRPITEYPTPLGDYLGAQAGNVLQGINDRYSYIFGARPDNTIVGYRSADGPFPDELAGAPIYGDDPSQQRIDAATAQKRLTDAGVKLQAPESGMYANTLDSLIQRQQEQTARQVAIAGSPTGLRSILGLGVQLGTSMLDPLNIASSFVPVIGPAKYTALLADAGSALARFGIRAGVGAAEGAAGTAILQPLEAQVAKNVGDDYTMTQALENVAFGAVFGAGLHSIGGAFHDVIAGAPTKAPVTTDVPTSVPDFAPRTGEVVPTAKPLVIHLETGDVPISPLGSAWINNSVSHETRIAATSTAVSQLLDGRGVTVEPVLRADPALQYAMAERQQPTDMAMAVQQAREDIAPQVKAELTAQAGNQIGRDTGLSVAAAEPRAAKPQTIDMGFGESRNFQIKGGEKITVSREPARGGGATPEGYVYRDTDPSEFIARNSRGEEIGHLAYTAGDRAIDSEVVAAYRRRGVGTILYDLAAHHGATLEGGEKLGTLSNNALAIRSALSSAEGTPESRLRSSMAEPPREVSVSRPLGPVEQLREQLDQIRAELDAMGATPDKSEVRALQQGQKLKFGEAQTRAQTEHDARRADLESQAQRLEQQIDTNRQASQAAQDLAALNRGEFPERYNDQVQQRAEQLLQGDPIQAAVRQMFDPSPDADRAAAQRFNSPENVAVSDPVASRAVDENLKGIPEAVKDAGSEGAELSMKAAEEKYRMTLDQLKQSGASERTLDSYERELAPFDADVKDAEALGKGILGAALCGVTR